MTTVDDNETIGIGPDPDKLTLYHRQQLSAMLDGELSPDEAKFMLRRLQHDGELADCWERWQVCGDVLRGRRDAILPADFAQRVARGIAGGAAAAPAVEATGRAGGARRPRLLRWGGGALAASVALVAVFSVRQAPDAGMPGAAQDVPDRVVAAAPALPGAQTALPDDAMAMAGGEASGQTPAAPALRDAPVLAAVALAADAPRRAAQRRAQSPPQQRATRVAPRQAADVAAAEAATAPVLLASMDTPPAAEAAIDAAFPAPPALQVRPWPRSILPGASEGGLNVGYGRLIAVPSPAGAAPFQPRIDRIDRIDLLPSAPAEPQAATDGGAVRALGR